MDEASFFQIYHSLPDPHEQNIVGYITLDTHWSSFLEPFVGTKTSFDFYTVENAYKKQQVFEILSVINDLKTDFKELVELAAISL